MIRLATVLAAVLLVLFQDGLVSGYSSRGSIRSSSSRTGSSGNGCPYPSPSQGSLDAEKNDYFTGSMSLLSSGSSGGKKRGTLSLSHSVLLFRGKVYEWGSSEHPWPSLGRDPSSCDIKWNMPAKNWSKCTTHDIKQWSDNYKNEFGIYKLLTNNCHYYVQRMAEKLNSHCGR